MAMGSHLLAVRRTARRAYALAPDPWDMDEFLDRLEHWRGRPIDLCGVEWTPSSPTGAWYPRRDHDVVVYARNTTGWHQDVIILHELGHMLLNHRPHCVLAGGGHVLAPAALTHLLDRSRLAVEERQAEHFARLLGRWIGLRPQLDAFTRRMVAAFG